MTAWPSDKPDIEFLPMVGGYPEAPWTQNKKPLEPKNRFAMSPAKTEADIGEDIIKTQKRSNDDVYEDYPYAACEFGPGNQVTQHRRPIIGENDGYGVGFTRFASGVNWLGYYMYHGGRNPNDGLWQESRRTGYLNNYPIIDYDFQSPLSRFGDCRPHGDRLRLLHLFINTFDTEIAKKQPFFPEEKRRNSKDISMPSCSVRMSENGDGYFFVCAYERGLRFADYNDVAVQVNSTVLPKINIKSNSMFFYPFNLKIGEVLFDYVLAQPVTKTEKDGKTVCYFAEIDGVTPSLKINGETVNLPIDTVGFDENGVQIIVLSKKNAMRLHRNDNDVFFADGNVYSENGVSYCETTKDTADLSKYIHFEETKKRKLPYGYYLYSYGKRKYYSLKIDRDILKDRYDVKLQFDFTGLNLQLFCGKTLIDDYFNTTGKYVIRLREFKKYIESGDEFIIKTVPSTSFGISKVYNEINLKSGENSLSLDFASEIFVLDTKGRL